MKKLTITVLLFLSFTVSAQDFDNRLLERYSTEELNDLSTNNQETYNMLVYALDNACYIIDLPKEKGSNYESIEMNDLSSLNFIQLGLNIEKTNQYLRISGTDKVLVVKSEWVLNHEMNKK